ncbi:MAG: hypothetical protein V1827_01590 [Candidatus Micrarchaeota archaeon]
MEQPQVAKRRLVERIVPRPVRRLFRWMNFHLKEDGRAICRYAKTLPEEQRKAVIEHGKDYTTAGSKRNLPIGVRNVAASLIVGQCMWYFVCPALYRIPEVRDSSFGWFISGGLDKLFLKSDDLLFQTGGYSAGMSAQFAKGAAGSVMIGSVALAVELATDFSRSYIEGWTQKKYGIMADGCARACGQTRPFLSRYSSLEAYQKAISYVFRPWTIGTYNQIYSSIYGILGSIWRTGPQLAIVLTVGRAIDRFFKKIAEWTGLKRLADRIEADAAERENKAMGSIKGLMGERRFTALKVLLAAESRVFWKWNPFKPAVSMDEADRAAQVIADYEAVLRKQPPIADDAPICLETAERIAECAGRLESLFGAKRLKRFAPSFQEFASTAGESDGESVWKRNAAFGKVIAELQNERRLS